MCTGVTYIYSYGLIVKDPVAYMTRLVERERERGRQAGRQADRQTDRDTESQRHGDRERQRQRQREGVDGLLTHLCE